MLLLRKNPAAMCSSGLQRSCFTTVLLKNITDMAAAPGAPSDQTQWDFSCDFDVDFPSEEHALIVYNALAVDKELQPDKVKRLMSVSNNKLSVRFEAVEARFLRASFSAFVDVLTLATRTIQEFGQTETYTKV